MSFEKRLDSEIFTPADEKDYLDSAHASEDEIIAIKNKEKFEVHENAAHNGENVEEDDSFSSKIGMKSHLDEPKEERARQPRNKGRDINEQEIDKARKDAFYRKSA